MTPLPNAQLGLAEPLQPKPVKIRKLQKRKRR